MSDLIMAVDAAGGRARGLHPSFANPVGLDPDRLAGLRLPGGDQLPGALRAWLGYAANWLGMLDLSGEHPRWRSTPLRDLLADLVADLGPDDADSDDADSGAEDGDDDGYIEYIADELGMSLDAPVVELPSDEQVWFAVLAEDVPVGVFHRGEAWIAAGSFADYLLEHVRARR